MFSSHEPVNLMLVKNILCINIKSEFRHKIQVQSAIYKWDSESQYLTMKTAKTKTNYTMELRTAKARAFNL